MNERGKWHNNILEWSIILGIVIVLNLFFNFAITTFYPAPEWDDFCQNRNVLVENQQQCEAEGGEWFDHSPRPAPTSDKEITGYCDIHKTCQAEFDDARDDRNRFVFIVLVILGVLTLIVGTLVKVKSVSLGLSYGGVLSLIIASFRFWPSADDYMRLAILAAALAALIWVGYKKFK